MSDSRVDIISRLGLGISAWKKDYYKVLVEPEVLAGTTRNRKLCIIFESNPSNIARVVIHPGT